MSTISVERRLLESNSVVEKGIGVRKWICGIHTSKIVECNWVNVDI